jgi:spore germination protein GerM
VNRSGTRRSAAAALALVTVGAVGAVAGCGVPLDRSPHPIAQTTIAVDDTIPTTVAGDGTQVVTVYFLNGDTLQGQEYAADEEPTLSDALAYVLAAPAPDASADLHTAVPPGTELRSAEVTDGVATIDLTNQINDVSGPSQKEAFAQIVFTALAIDGIQQVRFLIDGEPVDAPTDNGNLAVISADDYDKPLNPR